MSKNIFTKEKRIVNAILLSTHGSFSFKKMVYFTDKVFKKRKISLSIENISILVKEVIEEFKEEGLIDGDNKTGYCLNIENHYSNNDFEETINDLSRRNLQM